MIGWKVIPQTVYGLLGLSLRKNNIIHSLPHVLLAGPLAYCWSWSSLEKGAGHDGRGHAVRSFFVWAFYGSVCPVGPVFSTLSGLCPGFVQACVLLQAMSTSVCPHLCVGVVGPLLCLVWALSPCLATLLSRSPPPCLGGFSCCSECNSDSCSVSSLKSSSNIGIQGIDPQQLLLKLFGVYAGGVIFFWHV